MDDTENGSSAEIKQQDGIDDIRSGQVCCNDDEDGDSARREKDKEPPSPRQASAAVDMTGSIKLPTSVVSKFKKRSSRNNSGTQQVEESSTRPSLSKQRFRYNGSNDEDSSSRGFDFSSDTDLMSGELTVQQIHDQRLKLSAQSTTKKEAEAAALPVAPSTHQISASSSKGPRTRTVGMPMGPGAYSVAPSSNDVSVVRSKDSSDDDSDILGNADDSDSPSSIMQLEAIPVDETLEQAKMKEMEEQMNLEISRRLSLERKITEERTTGTTGRRHGKGDWAATNKERMPIIMAILILVSGISVGIYFLVAPAPKVESPSSSTFFFYPPPTEEECSAVKNGTTVPDQDKYFPLMMEITMDVSFRFPLTDDSSIDAVLLEVEDNSRSVFIPTVLGCTSISQSQEYFNTQFTPDRYVLANMDIRNVSRSTVDCKAGEPEPCVRAVVHYIAWLKGETDVFRMISFVQRNFGPKLIQDVSSHGDEILKMSLVSISSPGHDDTLPSAVDFLFPPPTEEECEAVLNGQPVPDQDTYIRLMVDTTFDVSTYGADYYTNDTVLLEVQEKVQSNAVPTMVGCTTIGQDIANSTDRYILANAKVTRVMRSGFECEPEHFQPCQQLVIRFSLWLKSQAELFDLVATLHTNFRPILMESITDSIIIREFVLVSIGPSPLDDDHEDNHNPKVDVSPSVDLLFPPPTEERCEQFLNGTAIADRDRYFTIVADGVIDVSTYNSWEESLDVVLLELRNQFESTVLPVLAGCKEIDKDLLKGKNMTADRYMMADAVVLDVTKSPSECNAEEPQPCVRAVVRLQMWAKMEVSIFEIIAAIDQNFGPALIEQIGSDDSGTDIIKHAEMVILLPLL
ncbi:unnamed protein product [Cylindrotheca closterium]|uniref:Uncharacterized protein n=1 Tax=Cylindrotheca closterium TaxID=2856 RepID=A0AAD2FMR9_9STRA|nr:unnamed protein product [Cylindrotheca closterium]